MIIDHGYIDFFLPGFVLNLNFDQLIMQRFCNMYCCWGMSVFKGYSWWLQVKNFYGRAQFRLKIRVFRAQICECRLATNYSQACERLLILKFKIHSIEKISHGLHDNFYFCMPGNLMLVNAWVILAPKLKGKQVFKCPV